MLFTTDKQTLDDLNIFGRHGGDSMYNIFNRCVTRGGAAVLEEMFRYPLSDHEAINRRCTIIRFFADSVKQFPFQSSLFDATEPYLANTDERTKLSAQEHSVTKKIINIVAVDADTQQIHNGINALVTLLKEARDFINRLSIPGDHAYAADKAVIVEVLTEQAFKGILESKGKLSQEQLSTFDVLLRFRFRIAIQKLLRTLHYLDVYIAVGRVAEERAFVLPVALPRGHQRVGIEGVYHPQVQHAIPNNIYITPEGNVIFLTGANMAGKSTFMKSLSIALYLAHMGFPVAAAKMEFAVLDGIYTTINLPDNLDMGASHFYAEVLRVKKMAIELRSGKNLFITFDELFRGTNVKDAYEATIVITKGFAKKINSLFVISTHIIEAGDVLKAACPNLRFVYLPTRMNEHQPVYTYKLEEGITDDRHGMIIINNERILETLEAGLPQMIPV